MPIAKTAFIDESLRARSGLYVLVAVIAADSDADAHRQAMSALLHRGQLRLHWRDESAKRRSQLVSALCRLRLTGAVVIAAGVASRRQERARRKCVERLLAELVTRGIATMTFEQRHDELDARDRALVAALKRRQSLPAAARASWQSAVNEPLLWLPDIAAGAAALAETGDPIYWNALADAFSVDRFLLG
jgi:hypothetical protein